MSDSTGAEHATPTTDVYKTRFLQIEDYDLGYEKLLAQLTDTGGLTKEKFEAVFKYIASSDHQVMIVIEKTNEKKIIATGTLLLERKYIHNGGAVAHIEDVVVDKAHRGKGFGKDIINYIINIARHKNCYKAILDCAEHNVHFYQGLGFVQKEKQMAYYLK